MKCGDIVVKYKIANNKWMLKKGTPDSSGFDICAISDYELAYNSPIVVKTGLFLEIPSGFEGQIRSRSGLAAKGVFVLNSPGTIDSDYRGEVGVILNYVSESCFNYKIKAGDRIAQLVFCKLPSVTLCQTDNLSFTTRQDGGFGSTGLL